MYAMNKAAYAAKFGVWLHIYADGFAHAGFTGHLSPSINTRRCRVLEEARFGHNDAGYEAHEPDILTLNVQTALAAAEAMYNIIPPGRGSPSLGASEVCVGLGVPRSGGTPRRGEGLQAREARSKAGGRAAKEDRDVVWGSIGAGPRDAFGTGG